ncbi:MAG TPA: NADPH-dependent 7-cyano-7-deazaguanine reductase QueF [Cellvibrionaceae bacterium]
MADILYGTTVQLGQQQAYSDQYDANLLQPIERKLCRQQLSIQHFLGVDIWTGYEISWLDMQGKPCVDALEFIFPADSTHIIESKSFKYYLNSFNQTRIESTRALMDTLIADLSAAAGATVTVQQYTTSAVVGLSGQIALDTEPLMEPSYQPAPQYLRSNEQRVNEIVFSDLLKTNCPVTGQPDWASIWIGYTGGQIDHAGLLAYIVSYRQQQDFHENCVEQIFCDLWQRCAPEHLWVYARYTRRGGLDINPFRTSQLMAAPSVRGFRQ